MITLSGSKSKCFMVILGWALIFIFCLGQTAVAEEKKPGSKLYLVSVGSGDADNITIRATNVIKDSDIILCDKSIRDKFEIILNDKEIHDSGVGIFWIYGKSLEEVKNQYIEPKKMRMFNYDEKMKEFNEISSIIRKAIKEGKTVSVLESGDPSIYGQHMWYMEAFEDLNPEIVPGISCFNAGNAALKKEVTSGNKNHSVILTSPYVNRQCAGTDGIEDLAAVQASMVFFTMFLDFDDVVEKLRKHYPPDTPIAIVLYAGYKEKEKVIQGTLSTIKEQLKKEKKLPCEHLIYVGNFLAKH